MLVDHFVSEAITAGGILILSIWVDRSLVASSNWLFSLEKPERSDVLVLLSSLFLKNSLVGFATAASADRSDLRQLIV